ncbi:MAG: hypothetical protein LAP13_26680 [Acidobacteriia bacterium]|nr:hypothetical protein [Terriglobia bacterium]
MGVGTAIKQGLGMARRANTGVWVLFLVNLGLAALSAFPFYRGILRFTGYSLESRSLLRGFSEDWLTDFSFNSPGSLQRYAAVIAAFGLLTILVNAILAGGVLARFRDPNQPQGLGTFCRDTGRYAWRMVRLMVLGLICYWIVFRLLNQSLGGLVDKWTRDATNDRTVFWAHLPVVIVTVLGVVFVNLVMDYAKVKLVLDDDSSAVEAFLASLGFSLGKLRKALTVYLIPALLGIALLVIYRLVVPWDAIHASLGAAAGWRYLEPLVLALLFIGQQIIMLGRYWFRVATWASEWSYYSGSRG